MRGRFFELSDTDSLLVISDLHVGKDDIYDEDMRSFFDFLFSQRGRPLEVEGVPSSFAMPARIVSSTELAKIAGLESTTKVEVPYPTKIVLLGDFLDLWDGDFERIREFIVKFGARILEVSDVVYIRGNHDNLVGNQPELPSVGGRMFEILDYLIVRSSNNTYLLVHGHQFSLMMKASRFESLINPLYTLLVATLPLGGFLVWFGTLLFLALMGFWSASWLRMIPDVLASPVSPVVLALMGLTGLMAPLAVATLWRIFQYQVWKEFLSWILKAASPRGESISSVSKSWGFRCWWETERLRIPHKIDCLVFGHTHKPEQAVKGASPFLGDTKLMNTGSWMKPPRQAGPLLEFTVDILGSSQKGPIIIVGLWMLLSVLLGWAGRIDLIAWITALSLSILFVISWAKTQFRDPGSRTFAYIGPDRTGHLNEMILAWQDQHITWFKPPRTSVNLPTWVPSFVRQGVEHRLMAKRLAAEGLSNGD